MVRTLPAPFSCTISELWVGFGTRCRLTAVIVEPQATPTIWFESTNRPRIRAADSATRSSRSTSLAWSGTGIDVRGHREAIEDLVLDAARQVERRMDRDLDEAARAGMAEQAGDRRTRDVQFVARWHPS